MMQMCSRFALLMAAMSLPTALSLRCGSLLTSECIGKYDKRYDESFSTSLTDQDPVWAKLEGLWFVEYHVLGTDGKPVEPRFLKGPTSEIALYSLDAAVFYNFTVDGSRYINQELDFYPPAPQSFCEQPVPEGYSNVYGNGTCGETGLVYVVEHFGTSTYEKDGTVNYFWRNVGPTVSGEAHPGSKVYPVGNETMYQFRRSPGIYSWSETWVLQSENELAGSKVTSQFGTDSVAGYMYIVYNATRVTEESYLNLIEQYRTEYKIPDEDWAHVSLDGPCYSASGCPTSQDYCTLGKDPTCSQSPYQEPPASMKAGFIVLFTLIGVAILVIIAYAIHLRQLEKQQKRYKTMFAKQVAKRVDLRGSVGQLPPEKLAEEFRRIDQGLRKSSSNADGYITRDELWQFISSGKAGDMSEKDFDALFAAMDLQGRGRVNFVEFCAFMSSCGEELKEVQEEERLGRNERLGRSANRLSIAIQSSAPLEQAL